MVNLNRRLVTWLRLDKHTKIVLLCYLAVKYLFLILISTKIHCRKSKVMILVIIPKIYQSNYVIITMVTLHYHACLYFLYRLN